MSRSLFLFTVLTASLLLAACGKHAPLHTPSVSSGAPIKVKTAAVLHENRLRFQSLPGTVRPVERAIIASKIMGGVRSIPVRLGQRVAAGDILARLSANEIAARLEQAEAALAQARRDLERESTLLSQGASTAEAVRALEDKVRITTAAVNEAKTMLSYTEIQAPFEGVLTQEFVKEGDLASPGSKLFEIEGLGALRVEVRVPDSLPLLELGMQVNVELDATLALSTLSELSPAADPTTRTRLAKIDLPPGANARSGQFVRVEWPANKIESISIPSEALSPFGQMERVFVVSQLTDGQHVARLRLVKTTGARGAQVEILAGLSAGEKVVLNPPAALRDGVRLEVIE